jgi:hypothetical protein
VGPTAIYSPFCQNSILNYKSSDHPFFDMSSAIGSGSRHLHSHIPWVTIRPRPLGGLFLTSHPGTHAHVQNYRIIVLCSLFSVIFHIEYLVFMCAGTWSSHTSAAPLGIYDRHWHVVIPS